MNKSFVRKLTQGLILSTLLTATTAADVMAASTEESMLVDGRERHFLVHDFSGAAKAPAVIVLHGGGGNGPNAATQTGFDAVAEREQLIAVYPSGSSRFDDVLLTWNAGHCCAYAIEQNVDDVHFISLLIDELIASHNVDPTRIYVTGLSNGGMMTHRIGFELSHKVAAIAPVIASVFGDEPVREIAVPTLIINGADDQIVRSSGGELGGIASQTGGADGPIRPVAAQGEYWASVNDCGAATSTNTTTYQKFVYACANGNAVERYLITGNGHAWPGGTAPRPDADPPVQTFNANEVIWDFFKRFQREPVLESLLKPYYYDGDLNVPVLMSQSGRYSAKLRLVRTLPTMEFRLMRTARVPGSSAIPPMLPTFDPGTLTLSLPELHAGSDRYSATVVATSFSLLGFLLGGLNLLP